ncbi:hypothetical protein lerEdw1_008978 [Lerista edwardsae]|nr:hypothetical protein lerEdw1_008978 [Lerista edwardsae]
MLVPPCAPAKRDSPRRRLPERASPGGRSSAPAPHDQPPPRYDFTAQELHAVLYGDAFSAGRPPPRSPGAGDFQPPLLDRSALQLPEGLTVLQTVFTDGPQLGVFCTETIPKGIRFGPFQGKVVNISEIKTYDDNSLMWEVPEVRFCLIRVGRPRLLSPRRGAVDGRGLETIPLTRSSES